MENSKAPRVMGSGEEKDPRGGERGRYACASLPIELWMEILLRVPAEDLVNLERVCKSWHQLITTSRSFAHSQLLRRETYHQPVDGLVTSIRYSSTESGRPSYTGTFYFPFGIAHMVEKVEDCASHGERKLVWPLASCDGLLLVCPSDGNLKRMRICNPLTGSNSSLAAPPGGTQHSIAYEWTIVRDGSIGRYKVFAMQRVGVGLFGCPSNNRICYVSDIHLNEGGKWQSKYSRMYLDIELLTDEWDICSSTVVGGKVYWLARFMKVPLHFETKLVWVDVKTGEFSASDVSKVFTTWSHFCSMPGAFYYANGDSKEDRVELWTLTDLERQHPAWTELSMNVDSDSCLYGLVKKIFEAAASTSSPTSIIEYRHVFDMVSMKWVNNTMLDIEDIYLVTRNMFVPHVHSLLGAV